MVHLPKALLLYLAPLLLTQLSHAGGDVHVIATSSGLGVDFTDIQAAVNGAAAGDLLLIRPGSYSVTGLTIQKSLTLVADTQATGSVTLNGTLTISNLASTARVGLSDLAIVGVGSGLELSNNAGQVYVESCSIEGSAALPFVLGGPGAVVTNCTSVTFVDCDLDAASDAGSDGLSSDSSGLHLFDSVCRGSKADLEQTGGAGCSLTGTAFYSMGSTFQGGEGGDGDPALMPFFACGDGADGGPGLSLDATSSATLADNSFKGGPGGAKVEGGSCIDGVQGPGLANDGASITYLPFDARNYEIESPVRAGDNTQLEWTGLPGELCWLVISASAEPRFVPIFQGLAIPDDPTFILFVGTVPASGTHSISVNIGLHPSKECVVVWEQGLYFRASVGFVLSTPRQGVILQTGF